MRNEKIDGKTLLSTVYRLTRFVVCSLFLFAVFLILLFVVGNYQNFLDASQTLVLSVLSRTLAVLFFLSFFCMLQGILLFFFDTFRLRHLFFLLFLIFCAVFSALGLSFAQILSTLADGL